MRCIYNNSFQTNDEGDSVLGDYDLQVKPGFLVTQVVIMDIGFQVDLEVVHINTILEDFKMEVQEHR